MVVEVKPVAGPFVLGEGPHWDEETKSLYFVDINGQFLCKFNPATETVTKCALDRKVGFVLPVEGKKDQFLIGYGEDFAVVTWDGQSEKPQDVSIHVKGDPSPDNRINDGKADPTGRVYAGEYDGQMVFDLKENNIKGIPDGMTIDEQGKLWVSVFGGGKIIRVDPDTKQLLFTLPVPAHQTTSVAWGGDNYDELYITSANFPDYIPEEERDKYSHNGYLFKATGLGVKGLPPTNAKL
ncbi:regucalcin-like [Diaphorina citri]|uniref:Regucalcin-like n=1 Tax=Diaphorina citri TaxID=121845 RepID=A0A3Q0JE89_DIACI|nr:regucalcin-like [Diaphorina citri]